MRKRVHYNQDTFTRLGFSKFTIFYQKINVLNVLKRYYNYKSARKIGSHDLQILSYFLTHCATLSGYIGTNHRGGGAGRKEGGPHKFSEIKE